jgi:hypothetical protein
MASGIIGGMATTDESALRASLYEQAALWRVRPEVGQERLVRLACDALVAGLDRPGLAMLAGMSVHGHDPEFGDVLQAAFDGLGIRLPQPGTAEAQVGAATAMARLLLDGHLTSRELARWAHAVIGHDGAPELQSLVEFDDAYEIVDYVDPRDGVAGVDRQVRGEAERLVSADVVDR